MRLGVRLKYWLFEHYWWVLCLVLVFALGLLLWRNESIPTIVTVVGSLLSLIYLLQKQKIEELVDYFNLCGEEYLYFERGYIDPVVWRAWHNGMKAIFSVQRVQRVWEVEKRTGSYYGLPL